MFDTTRNIAPKLPLSQEGIDELDYLKIEVFYEKYWKQQGNFHPEGHWIFACHAAFPVLLTPDLLYKLWMNFRTFPGPDDQELHIPYLAVSDLLLSNLIREAGPDMYEMLPGVRFALLQFLQKDTRLQNENRISEVARFVSRYIDDCLQGTDARTSAFRETQQWAIQAYLDPDAAIRKIYEELQQAIDQKDDYEKLKLHSRLERLEQQYSMKLQVNTGVDYAKKLEHLLNFTLGTKELLYQREENAITAFSQIPEPDYSTMSTSGGIKGTLTIPKSVGGKLTREKKGPGHDGEQIYALLVGIDKYQNPQISQLSGCVNDARNMADYLRAFHADKDLRIVTLLDEEATYQNIIKNFEQHYRLAGPEDIVLFYFAGHADLVSYPLDITDQFSDEKEPGLVCYDSRSLKGENIIFSLDLTLLLEEAAKRQPQTVLILDSHYCHRMTSVPPQLEIPAEISDNADNRSVVHYLNGYFSDKRGTQVRLGTNHVVLAATELDEQVSREMNVDGKVSGIFTHNLIRAASEVQGEISYQDLINRVKFLVKNQGQEQVPAMIPQNGFDPGQGFLGKILPETSDKRRYQISFDDLNERGWTLNAGQLHGITEEQSISVYDGEEFLGVAMAIEVGIQSCRLYFPTELPMEMGKFYVGEPESETGQKLRIYASEDNITMLSSFEIHPDVEWATVRELSDYEIEVENGLILFGRTYDPPLVDFAMIQSDITNSFNKIFNWLRLLNIENPRTGLSNESIELIPWFRKADGSEKQIEDLNLELDVEEDEQVELFLRVNNHFHQDAHVAIFYLGEDFRITTLGNQKINPGESSDYQFEGVPRIFLSHTSDREMENFFFKSIISTERIDHFSLRQSGLQKVPVNRNQTR